MFFSRFKKTAQFFTDGITNYTLFYSCREGYQYQWDIEENESELQIVFLTFKKISEILCISLYSQYIEIKLCVNLLTS